MTDGLRVSGEEKEQGSNCADGKESENPFPTIRDSAFPNHPRLKLQVETGSAGQNPSAPASERPLPSARF
jgi:hypothetical protein